MNDRITNWTRADDAMVEHAIRRGATRRELLQLMMAGGVGLMAGGTILGRATAAITATPVRGGSIRAAGWSSSTADTLDPARASLSTDYVRCCAFYNRLTLLDSEGNLQMELAESVETDDARTWVIRLKPDVTFHDGKTLTAQDVVFSLNRHLDPATASRANAMAQQMTSIRAADDRTVEIELEMANADLPVILALHHFMIVADGTTDFSAGNGTGAFVCEVFEPGNRSIGVRNENYFMGEGAHLDSFEYFAISDDTARVNALLSDDIQLAASINPRSMRLAETQPNVDLSVTTSGNYTNLNIRLDMSPGDRANFVEGMKYLVNREQIQRSVMRGLAEIGNDQPVPPTSIYHNAELQPKAFDPERARSLFEQAGVLGQSIPVIASEAAGSSIDMAVVIQQAAADAGLTLDVQRVPSDGYWSNYWIQSPVHFGNINPRPTPDILFSLLYQSDAAWNESRFRSERFDAMLLEARGLLDEDRRREIYGEMQVMVSEGAGTIIPVYLSNVDAISSRLKGLLPSPLGGQMGYDFARNVWLES